MARFNYEEYLYREKIKRFLGEIDFDSDAIIVEGKKDKQVLEKLGVSTKIFMVSKRELKEFCETVSRCSESVAVLTDFDEAGKEINKKLVQELREETDILSSYRRDFGKLLTSRDRYCIEDIRPLLGREFDKFDEVKLSRLYSRLG